MGKKKECKKCLNQFELEFRQRSDYCPICRPIIYEKNQYENTMRCHTKKDIYKVGKYKMF